MVSTTKKACQYLSNIDLSGPTLIFLIFIGLSGFLVFQAFFTRQETFASSFKSCRNKGYTKEFCLQTPTANFGPSACTCLDGRLGGYLPGFRGQCICGDLEVIW